MNYPSSTLFLTISGALLYHDNQVQLENLYTIIATQHCTIQELLDRLSPPTMTVSL